MKTALKSISRELTPDEMEYVKFHINFIVSEQEARRSFMEGNIVGYYDSDDNEVIINSTDVIADVSSKGYDMYVKRYFI